MFSITTSTPVLVTGATGYVAGQIVKRLLEEGVTVHAAVRDPGSAEKLKNINELATRLEGEIKYFRADLLKPGSYRSAMQGCSVVFHTASPFTTSVKDPQRELVDPALEGTRNVLEEVHGCDSVRRVVLTSSCAAMYGDNADVLRSPEGILTEQDWNTTSSLLYQPYSYSKTLAEKKAWELVEQQSRWDLVAINPSLVIGPGINPQATSESFSLIKQLGDGSLKSGVPRYGFGCVDVRDVADAHLAAAFTDDAQGRYIISAESTDLFQLAQMLREKYGNAYPIPRRALPKWLVWLVAPWVNQSMTRRIVARNVGVPWRADNRKGMRELGVRYRPLDTSINEMFQQMIDSGLLDR